MSINLPDPQQSHGFSLIEMAIVLVIVMTVLTLGLSALSSVVISSATKETKVRQDRIKDALIAYLGANKQLPCPARGNPATSDKAGIADCLVLPGLGIVPYATLGLGREVAEDGWQNFFSYQVYSGRHLSDCTDSSDTATPSTSTTDNNWTIAKCFGAGKSGGLWIYDGSLQSGAQPTGLAFYNSGPPPADLRAVAVIISHGPNGLGAWARQGTQNALPPDTRCEEKMNADRATLAGGCTFPAPTLPASIPAPSNVNTFIAGGQQGSDDIVAYLSADDMIQALAKQGSIKSATAQVIDDLEKLKYQIIELKTDCTTSITPTLENDPWGKPYKMSPPSGAPCSIIISGGTPSRAIPITPAEFCKLAGIACPAP